MTIKSSGNSPFLKAWRIISGPTPLLSPIVIAIGFNYDSSEMKRNTKQTKNNETNENSKLFRLFRYFSFVSCFSSFHAKLLRHYVQIGSRQFASIVFANVGSRFSATHLDGLNKREVPTEKFLSRAAVGQQNDLVGNVSRMRFAQHFLCVFFSSLPGNDYLFWFVEVIIECREHLGHLLWKLVQSAAEHRQSPVGHLTQFLIAGHLRQPQQVQGRD